MDAHAADEHPLDRPRIRHLLKPGIFAASMVTAGDMLPGWGAYDASKPGICKPFTSIIPIRMRLMTVM